MITVSQALAELRRLPAALPLDRAHPELAARGRASRLRSRRRGLPQEQRHDDGAPLQPDEAEPRRRAGPRPHHRGGGPRHGQGDPRVPGQAGADLLPGPGVPVRAQRDHRGEGDRLAGPGRRRHRHRRPRVGDLPRGRLPAALPAGPPVRPRADGPYRRVRPGRRGRAGRRAAGAGPHRPRRQGRLRPAGDGDDPRPRHRPRDLPDLEPQHPGRLRLGRVPLDLRHVPAQRGPVHDQHRRPRDAQDVHPRRDGASWAASASCRSRTRSRPRRRRSPRRSCRTCRDVPAPVGSSPPRATAVEREEA